MNPRRHTAPPSIFLQFISVAGRNVQAALVANKQRCRVIDIVAYEVNFLLFSWQIKEKYGIYMVFATEAWQF